MNTKKEAIMIMVKHGKYTLEQAHNYPECELWCTKCNLGYSIDFSNINIATVLILLNHSRSHA